MSNNHCSTGFCLKAGSSVLFGTAWICGGRLESAMRICYVDVNLHNIQKWASIFLSCEHLFLISFAVIRRIVSSFNIQVPKINSEFQQWVSCALLLDWYFKNIQKKQITINIRSQSYGTYGTKTEQNRTNIKLRLKLSKNISIWSFSANKV